MDIVEEIYRVTNKPLGITVFAVVIILALAIIGINEVIAHKNGKNNLEWITDLVMGLTIVGLGLYGIGIPRTLVYKAVITDMDSTIEQGYTVDKQIEDNVYWVYPPDTQNNE